MRRCVCASVPLVFAACNLQEVVIPIGQERVVVQGVLTLDSAVIAQYVVVEQSLTGTAEIPEPDSTRGPPQPPLPISGALVVVTRDDSASVRFVEGGTPGVYELPRNEALAFLAAGREYRLRVVTPDGRVVLGRTRMPGFPFVAGMPVEGSTFNRDRDTLRIRWSGAGGTKGVFVQVRPRDIARRLTFLVFTDSTRFELPGTLVLPFLSDTLPPAVWVAGTRQTFTVAAMDTNFFDHLRTRSDPFTGGGFLNRLEGGLGVFGSMAPVNRTLEVLGDADHPYEGRYLVRAAVGSDSLGGELELFVNQEQPGRVLVSGLFSGVSGLLAPLAEAAGWVAGGRLHLRVFRDEPGEPGVRFRVLLEGGFAPAGGASGAVLDEEGRALGRYAMTRVP